MGINKGTGSPKTPSQNGGTPTLIKASVSEIREGEKTFCFNGDVNYIDYFVKVSVNVITIDGYMDAYDFVSEYISSDKKSDSSSNNKNTASYVNMSKSQEHIKGDGDIKYFNSSCEFYIKTEKFGNISQALVKGMIGSVTYESMAEIDFSKIFPKIGTSLKKTTSTTINKNSSITSTESSSSSGDVNVIAKLQKNNSYVREVTWYPSSVAKGKVLSGNSEGLINELKDSDYKGALSIRTVLTQNKAIQTFST